MRVLGNIPNPITVIIGAPFLEDQLPVRAVLLCPHTSGFHLMDTVDPRCLGHEPVMVKPPLSKPCHQVVIGPIV